MHPNPHPYPAYKSSGVEWLGHIPAHWADATAEGLGNDQSLCAT